MAQAVATAPWRAAGAVAHAVTRAVGQAVLWSRGAEPAAEGPVSDPAAHPAPDLDDPMSHKE
eukprot:6319031-Alexandrium_andersonii.AAC.1